MDNHPPGHLAIANEAFRAALEIWDAMEPAKTIEFLKLAQSSALNAASEMEEHIKRLGSHP